MIFHGHRIKYHTKTDTLICIHIQVYLHLIYMKIYTIDITNSL